MTTAILVVEDELALARNIANFLNSAGFEARAVGSAEEALRELETFKPEVLLIDFNLPGMNGLQAIARLRDLDPGVKILMMTGQASVEMAVDAMKAGASDFLTKPVSLAKLRLMLEKLTTEERRTETLAYYRNRDARASGIDKLLGESPAMRELRAAVEKVIAGDVALKDGNPPAVLVTGETGTGKELVARALHFGGPRSAEPFVEINCASIPGQLLESELFGYERGAFTDAKARKLGLVETADRGTLFLDEIGDMELLLQVKLLRVLEDRTVRRVGGLRDKPVNVRIVAATNQHLEALVADGKFRADLFYRIRMVHLAVPPLRERGDDILLLAEHYLALHGRRYGREGLTLAPAVREALLRYRWPGNVRELRNTMEHTVLMSSGHVVESVDLEWLQSAVGAPLGGAGTGNTMKLGDLERDALHKALEACQWNVSRAARQLGITRDALRYRIQKHGLAVPE
jgi:two-component system, NtrC family, response regulator AtoC